MSSQKDRDLIYSIETAGHRRQVLILSVGRMSRNWARTQDAQNPSFHFFGRLHFANRLPHPQQSSVGMLKSRVSQFTIANRRIHHEENTQRDEAWRNSQEDFIFQIWLSKIGVTWWKINMVRRVQRGGVLLHCAVCIIAGMRRGCCLFHEYALQVISVEEKLIEVRTACIPPVPPDHLLLDRSPNIGLLISRWKLDKFKNCRNKSFRTSKILTLLYQQFSNLLISQRDMSGPRLEALSNNRCLGGTALLVCCQLPPTYLADHVAQAYVDRIVRVIAWKEKLVEHSRSKTSFLFASSKKIVIMNSFFFR
jgi:hypothetical protein